MKMMTSLQRFWTHSHIISIVYNIIDRSLPSSTVTRIITFYSVQHKTHLALHHFLTIEGRPPGPKFRDAFGRRTAPTHGQIKRYSAWRDTHLILKCLGIAQVLCDLSKWCSAPKGPSYVSGFPSRATYQAAMTNVAFPCLSFEHQQLWWDPACSFFLMAITFCTVCIDLYIHIYYIYVYTTLYN